MPETNTEHPPHHLGTHVLGLDGWASGNATLAYETFGSRYSYARPHQSGLCKVFDRKELSGTARLTATGHHRPNKTLPGLAEMASHVATTSSIVTVQDASNAASAMIADRTTLDSRSCSKRGSRSISSSITHKLAAS